MSSHISQILSNFKLFSQNAETIPNKSLPIESTIKYKLTLGFLIVVVILLVYFKREAVSKVVAGWVNVSSVNDFLGNLWINTHLTSAGELASTYVPKEFSEVLSESVIDS